MKIQQEQMAFRPITIKLERRFEAEALLSLMDKICNCMASVDREVTHKNISEAEHRLAINISNAFTECKVTL